VRFSSTGKTQIRELTEEAAALAEEIENLTGEAPFGEKDTSCKTGN
jgi:hypothetical protein